MEEGLALHAGLLRLGGLVALVARMEVALEHVLGVGQGVGVDGLRLHQAHRDALDRAGDADLVAALGQDHVVEPGAGDHRAGGRHAEAHRDRDALLVL